MPIKRRRTSTSIMGMTDPGSLQAAVAAHVGRIQGAAASNVAGLQETVAAHVGGLQSGVAVHIRELQENIYRLQAALDALPAPSAPMPVVRTPPTKLPRFIAGIGIEVLQRKDFVQISAQDDPYGVLYQVTAVDTVAVTCTVRRVWQDGSLNESSEITGVLYQAALPVAVGDQGELVRLADGKLAFVKDYPWLWQVTAVGETTCTVQMVDASGDPVEATEITGLLYDTEPSVGDKAMLCRRSDGSLGIFLGGGVTSAGYDDSTIGSTGETEAADTTSWQRAGDPVGATLSLTWLWRQAYAESGDQKLYAYYRTTVFDNAGIYSVSLETRVIIDTPVEDCD